MSSEINIQKHKRRETTLDSDLKEKKIFDTVPLTWEEIENHPHVKAVGKLADAKTGEEKVAAIEEIFDNSRPQEVLRVETDLKIEEKRFDEVDFENNRRIRARADKELVERSADIQVIKATSLIHKALAAAGSLTITRDDPQYDQERLNHHRTVEKLLENLTDDANPLIFTASDMALEYITLDQMDEHPEVFPELYSFATMLYGVQNSKNYIREDDQETNQEHSVWLMKKLVNHSERAYNHGVIDGAQAVSVISNKYHMIYDVAKTAANGDHNKGVDAVLAEQAIDDQSPFLKAINTARRDALDRPRLEKAIEMRENMRAEHPSVVNPKNDIRITRSI